MLIGPSITNGFPTVSRHSSNNKNDKGNSVTLPSNKFYDQKENTINPQQNNLMASVETCKERIMEMLDSIIFKWDCPSEDRLIIMKDCFLRIWDCPEAQNNPTAFFEKQSSLLQDMNQNPDLRHVCVECTPDKSPNCNKRITEIFADFWEKQEESASKSTRNFHVLSSFNQSPYHHNANSPTLNTSKSGAADPIEYKKNILSQSEIFSKKISIDHESNVQRPGYLRTDETAAGENSSSMDDWMAVMCTTDVSQIPDTKSANSGPKKCFWKEVKKVIDNQTLVDEQNAMEYIKMCYLLDESMFFVQGQEDKEQFEIYNPPTACRVRAEYKNRQYRLTICDESDEQVDDDIAEVYWLPWFNPMSPINQKVPENRQKLDMPLGCTSVTVKDLNNVEDLKKCQFFLTSNLNGCRFVATDQYLAHFSKERRTSTGDGDLSPKGRDGAEKSLFEFKPRKRLAVSLSTISSDVSQLRDRLWGNHYSYQRKGAGLGAGTAFVIGIRQDDETWAIKYLKHSGGEQYGPSTWHATEYGEK